jgi:tetratricopeptide (TPR) repeat protein
VLAASQRDPAQLPLYEEAMRLYRELDDQRGMAVVRNALALSYKDQGEFERAEQLFSESAASWLALGDGLMRARALSNLASVNRLQRRTALALERHQEALSLFRDYADESGVAWALRHQADIARDCRDAALAESLYLQSHAAFEALGDAWSAGSLLVDLGTLALEQRDTATGLSRLRQAADAFQQLGGRKRGLARVLEGFALAASLDGDAARAICLAGAAAGLRTSMGTPLTPAEQRQVTSGLEHAHASLSPAERSQAWSRGWTMTIDEAVAFGVNAGPEGGDG